MVSQIAAGSAGGARSPGMGMSPVDSFEQIAQLPRCDHDNPVRRRRPYEAASLQSLRIKRRPQAVMPENLDQFAASPPEDKKITGVRIALQSLLGSQSEGVHAATHARVASRNPHPNARGNWDHRRDSTLTTRANAAASTSAPTITRSPPVSAISIRPAGVGGVGEVVGTGPGPITAGTKVSALAVSLEATAPNARRQVNSMLAFTSWRRATIDTEAPSSNVSATIRRFSSSDHNRRPRRSPPPAILPSPFGSDIRDRVHHRLRGHDHRVNTKPGLSADQAQSVQAAPAGGIRSDGSAVLPSAPTRSAN